MKRLFKCVLVAILAFPVFSAFAEDLASAKPLEVGIVPYISARAVIANFEPMRLYLEQSLGRPVRIYTANGFKQFFLNAQKGDYDLVISAAHIARLLQKENKFIPIVKFSPGVHSLFMTKLNSPLKSPRELRGQVIAVPDQLSFAAIVGTSWLSEKGLKAETDYKILEVPSFPSALLAVQKGEAVAAISVPPVLAQIPKELRDSLRVLADAGEFLQFIFLTHPRLGSQTSSLLGKELLRFAQETDEGKQFLVGTGFGTIVPALSNDMNSLDKYTSETRRLLNTAP
jgi:phosphonate transport system substrate-binding protein